MKKKAKKEYKKPLDIICHKIVYDPNDVEGYCQFDGLGNAHTHGLEDYGQTNVCLGIDLDKDKTSYILNTVADILCDPDEYFDKGALHVVYDRFGGDISDEIETFRFFLTPVICCGEPCDLIVLADENGLFPFDEGCKEPYNVQMMSHHEIRNILPFDRLM